MSCISSAHSEAAAARSSVPQEASSYSDRLHAGVGELNAHAAMDLDGTAIDPTLMEVA